MGVPKGPAPARGPAGRWHLLQPGFRDLGAGSIVLHEWRQGEGPGGAGKAELAPQAPPSPRPPCCEALSFVVLI